MKKQNYLSVFGSILSTVLISAFVLAPLGVFGAVTLGTNMSTTGTFTQTVGSATAALFQNAAGTLTTLSVDTTNVRVGVGGAASTTFEVQGTASASYFFTQNTILVAGVPGATASVAYSRFGTATTGYSGDLDASNDLLITGALEVDGKAFFDIGASVAANFEITGDNRFGINAGAVTQTTLEVGGTASISGIASVSGNFAAGLTNTGTSSFNFDAPSTTKGGCFRIKDNDGSGYTYLRVTNGAGTFSTVDCR